MSACDQRRRKLRTILLRLILLSFLSLSFSAAAQADVVVLLEEPINLLGHIASTGHSALLITTLCTDDHLHLRGCRFGENGVVISRYQGFAGKYDWVAMSPEAYLYATDSPADSPQSVTPEGAASLRGTYSKDHPFSGPVQPHQADWVQLIGQAYRRRIVCIRVHTTPEQDVRLAARLAGDRNQTHYNFLFSNCADFDRQLLDLLFPGAVHRNLLFDAGMTTPKELAAGLHHYAKKHPELDYTVEVIPQVPGTIPRSGSIKGVTESFVKTTPYLTGLAYLNPVPFGLIIASGLLDHRYNAQKLAGKASESSFAQPATRAEAAPSLPGMQ